MIFNSRNAGIKHLANRGVSGVSLTAALGFACVAGVQQSHAEQAPAAPVAQGEALRRVNAMLASNLALSPENQPATTFQNVVSLADPDVVARAQTLSSQAGHNGLHYDYFRFKALFDKAHAVKADKIDIPAATYRIYAPVTLPAGQSLIEGSLLSHVVIDGHGATLSFASIGIPEAPLDKVYPRAAIHFGHSDHVTLRNLTLDWYEPLAVPVRVSGTGQPGSPQTLTVDPAYPVNDALPIPLRGLLPFDVASRQYVRSRDLGAGDYAAWAKEYSPAGAMTYLCPPPITGIPASTCFRYIGHQVYAFGPRERLTPLPSNPGNFLAGVRDNNFAAIVADGGTSYLTLSGITIYSSPGAGVMMINAGKAIRVSHVRIVRKPDAMIAPGEPKRLISTLSDAMDVINTAGDVVVEDCEIADQADDGINIRAAMARADVVDAHTVNVKAGAVSNFYRVGGLVDVYDDKGINLIAANVAIAAVSPPAPGKAKFTVALASNSPALQPGSAYQLRILDWDSENVVVQRNWFHDSAERGVVVHDSGVAVVDNQIERTDESAVQLLYDNESGTAEGAVASNVVIAGNLIRDVNVSWHNPATRSFAVPAAISVYFAARSGLSDSVNSPVGNVVARHLAITDNVIADIPGTGILVSQADDVILSRNQIIKSGRHSFGIPLVDANAIVVERTTHLQTAGNSADRGVAIPGI